MHSTRPAMGSTSPTARWRPALAGPSCTAGEATSSRAPSGPGMVGSSSAAAPPMPESSAHPYSPWPRRPGQGIIVARDDGGDWRDQAAVSGRWCQPCNLGRPPCPAGRSCRRGWSGSGRPRPPRVEGTSAVSGRGVGIDPKEVEILAPEAIHRLAGPEHSPHDGQCPGLAAPGRYTGAEPDARAQYPSG
jgi:hypothetical protein